MNQFEQFVAPEDPGRAAAQRLIAHAASLTLASASLRVFELEEERGELDWGTQVADLAFQQLDKLEQEDVSSESR